jgi:hypothetical protein
VNPNIQTAIGITFAGLKDSAIFTLVCIYNALKVVPEAATDLFWRMAYCYTEVDRWCQICFLGLVTPYEGGVLQRFDLKPPPIELEANDSVQVELCGANMVKDIIIRQYWGFGGPGAGAAVTWQASPATVATLSPSGARMGFCSVKSPKDPTVSDGKLTAIIGSQPGKGEFTIKVTGEKTYLLSGSSTGTAPFTVDDNLDIYLNDATTPVWSSGGGISGSKGPAQFQAKKGDTLKVKVRDTYGYCCSLSKVYLVDPNSHKSVLADSGFDYGCGWPGGDRGVVYEFTKVIPF